MGDERKFAAFISYSHATDKALGPVLQEGIEKFAKPWYRSRARRVFLDNSSLAAESDLTRAILDGLAQAEHFLLLASPASAKSTWVGKEVDWWLENRDRTKLFVLLTDGEARWDEGVLVDGSALPDALHDIPEPRCVDLRRVRELDLHAPEWESVLADVVAPLDGVEKAELIGHHARERRRTRRTVRATISVLVVLLVAAVIFAVRSQQESNRARQQTMVATSRQLVAQAAAIRDTRPDTARQLLAQAYRLSPSPEVVGALMESPSIPRVLRQPTMARDVAYSPQGELLAVARDRDVVLYEGTREKAVVPLDQGYAATVAFSPDGKYLAIGTSSGTGLLVEIAAPDRAARFQGTSGSMVRVVSFVPGRPLLVMTESAGAARLVDISDPASPRPGPVFAPGHPSLFYDAAAVSPDGHTWVRGDGGGTVELWDITVKPVLRGKLTGHTGQLTSLRFAPKGAVLASGSSDDTVRLWNLAQNTQYAVLSGASLGVHATAFSPDGVTLAVGDGASTIGLWDVTDPTRPRTSPALRGQTSTIAGLSFSADSRVLASASQDGPGQQHTVRLWNVLNAARSSAVAVLPGGGGVAFAPGPLLAAGFPWKLYDLADPAHPKEIRDIRTYNQGGGLVAFSPDGTKIAAGIPVVQHDTRTAEQPDTKQDGRAASLTYSPDGKLVGAAADLAEYQLWITEGDRAVAAGVLKGSASAARGIAFRADGRLAVTRGKEGKTLQFWDITNPSDPGLLHAEDTAADPVESVAFRQTGSVVTGHKSGSVTVWHSDDHRRISSVTRHVGQVDGLAPQPGGSLLASAGAAEEVLLWDLTDETRPAEVSVLHAGGKIFGASIAFSPDGKLLAGAETRTTIWSIDAAQALARLCADSPAITEAEWRQYLPDDPYDPPCA
ncbi:toll/interleukin-1 receptor domain-containing protein [Lentzea aerocolonigenes]|uniref:toll/interleukin-1 receptor domain-containing protein n=1 Tax=Lentzea aerocolonigenes TaxID=68170 RepID=UPI0004C4485C|nr:TIR domain-containing protein [Lentzea aerocolonigenes]MCP2241693.1 WD40 repeat [Lentzea aerocolonigenes]